MKAIKRIKARVTSKKWPGAEPGEIILLPENLKADFVKYNYGEILKEDPTEFQTPEAKAENKPVRRKRKSTKKQK